MKFFAPLLPVLSLLLFSGPAPAQNPETCSFLTPRPTPVPAAGALTEAVARRLPLRSRLDASTAPDPESLIDRHIFNELTARGVTPAGPASDAEFLRRVSLDLTGRIPDPARVLAFTADPSPDKRDRLITELLDSPAWVDKWTLFFGDLYRVSTRTTQVNRFPAGASAFYQWIRASLTARTPYDRIATALIAGPGTDSYQYGPTNFLIGGIVTGGPVQDIFDGQTVEISRAFLGISHIDCLLCHNGRGHLDALSLWGKNTTRQQAWGLASFLSHTQAVRNPIEGSTANSWSLQDDVRYRTDYALNTSTGNRPARRAIGTQTRIAPVYPFTGQGPAAGENYRAALARQIIADPQFSRAIVNYLWEHFFSRGLVTPSDAFDPARLDPDHPPEDPAWPLQASHPRLLNELAQAFAEHDYDLSWLMRQIVQSRAYQLSSRYPGEWNPAWEPLFARKLVRRLWAEELHDAIAVSSGRLPSYDLARTYPNLGIVQSALQLPEPANNPDRGGAVTRFLDAFLRGNRSDEPRRPGGSISQALALMNDPFVLTRIRATGSNAAPLLTANLTRTDPELVETLFLTVLSRPPVESERAAAIALLAAGPRRQAAEDLLWALYNKVDFIFNY